jgi:hypothetical protein
MKSEKYFPINVSGLIVNFSCWTRKEEFLYTTRMFDFMTLPNIILTAEVARDCVRVTHVSCYLTRSEEMTWFAFLLYFLSHSSLYPPFFRPANTTYWHINSIILGLVMQVIAQPLRSFCSVWEGKLLSRVPTFLYIIHWLYTYFTYMRNPSYVEINWSIYMRDPRSVIKWNAYERS